MSFKITQGDSSPSLLTTLSDGGVPVELSNVTNIRFIMEDKYERIHIDDDLQGYVNIVDPSLGQVEYVFQQDDTKQIGTYKAEFEVTYNNGAVETFPTENKITIDIVEEIL